MSEYRRAALEYVSAYRRAVSEGQSEETIEVLLTMLSDEDLAVLEELLIFAGEK